MFLANIFSSETISKMILDIFKVFIRTVVKLLKAQERNMLAWILADTRNCDLSVLLRVTSKSLLTTLENF